ncbi:hypothetical protein E3N88_28114 [Mikania micrantha]|uniref:Uncharacterized protein n=1 Tax=Mikania micrantha TaxID=192012 RepID=A0A5N6MYM1_9ASTR|nr:hypothetical protein E3N88_28114 [Mikania micrantha]
MEPLTPPQIQSQPQYDKNQQSQRGSGTNIDNSNRGRVGRGRGCGRGRSRRGHYGHFRPFSQSFPYSQQPPCANSQQWSWSSPTCLHPSLWASIPSSMPSSGSSNIQSPTSNPTPSFTTLDASKIPLKPPPLNH